MGEEKKKREQRKKQILLLRIRAVYELTDSLPLPNLSQFLGSQSKDFWEWVFGQFLDFGFHC